MKGLIVLRDLATYGTAPDTWVGPAVPASWDMHPEAGGWFSVWPDGRLAAPDDYAHAWLAVDDGTQGAFAVFGTDAFLVRLRNSSAKTWTLAELRADDGPAATAIKNAWKDDRPHLYSVDPETGEVTDLGPDPAYSPIGLYRRGIAGWGHAETLEGTEAQP